jgi:hypothetical protein
VTSGLLANAWIAPGLITSDGTDTGAKRSVTRGDMLAVVIEFVSFNSGDNLQIAMFAPSQANALYNRAYGDDFVGSWTKYNARSLVMALKYSDGTYAFVESAGPYASFVTNAFNSGSSPNERALYFSLPVPVRVSGAWVRTNQGSTGDYTVTLYDSDGVTSLASVAVDASQLAVLSGLNVFCLFTNDATLQPNTFYRLAIKPTTGNNVSIYDFTVNAAAIMDAVEGGQNFRASERTGAGAWSQTPTRRPFMGLLVTELDSTFVTTGLELTLPSPITLQVP